MKTTILFRADGSSKMGLGHIVRSLALARMLRADFNCHFATQNPSKAIVSQIHDACSKHIALPETELLLEEAHSLAANHLTGNEIVVLDGYHFNTEYQRIIKETGCKVVCIDDIHHQHYLADAIINHSGGVEKNDYSAEPNTQFFLGLDYVLLRKPFLQAAKNRLLPSAKRTAFVCLGGADPNNQTVDMLKRLQQLHSIKACYVVVGSAYRHRKALADFIQKSRLEIRLLENISAEKMVNVMRLCPIAITSPSTISIEYLAVGGDLYLQQTADNQADLFQYLLETGMAFRLENMLVNNKKCLKKAQEAQQNLLDGKSAYRLQKIFRQLERELHCTIRPAVMDDMMTYFNWANDALARQQSFSSSFITLSEHKHWFFKKISSPLCQLYLLEYKNEPVGQIRFDLGERAILSYSVSNTARGKGFGTYLLKKGVERLQQDLPQQMPIVGYVKSENIASNKAFLNLGFQQERALEREDTFVYSM